MAYRGNLPPEIESKAVSPYPQEPVTPVTVVTPEAEVDPKLTPDQWYRDFHLFHVEVVRSTPDLDWGWLQQHQPDLFQTIVDKEAELNRLGDARLGEVTMIMREWRERIFKAESERQGTNEQKHKEAKV